MVRTTTALTIFNAGDKDNVLPGNAEATVNFRLLPGDTEASVTDHVRTTIAQRARSRSRLSRQFRSAAGFRHRAARRSRCSTAPSAKCFPTWSWRPA